MKKAQIWSMDLIAGVTVFLIAMLIYFTFINNIVNNQEDSLRDIYNEALIVSDTLIYSSESNRSNVTSTIHFITENNYKINTTKLQNVSGLDYSELKLLLKTKYDYLIFFENMTGEIQNISGVMYIGKEGVTRDNIDTLEEPENLVSIKRFLIHSNKIVTMEVYLWG